MDKDEIIDYLAKTNSLEYNLHKASEELLELALVLTQTLTKSTHKPDDQATIDEIGDVIIRLGILKKLYNKEKIKERVNYKLSKYTEYIDHKSYKNI